MAKGQKTGGKDFEPGTSGNPKGRPPLPEDIKIVRAAPQAELDEILDRLIPMPAEDLEKLSKDKATPGMERALAKALYLAGRSGDPRRLAVIMDRRYGRSQPPKELPSEKRATSFVDLVLQAEEAKENGKP